MQMLMVLIAICRIVYECGTSVRLSLAELVINNRSTSGSRLSHDVTVTSARSRASHASVLANTMLSTTGRLSPHLGLFYNLRTIVWCAHFCQYSRSTLSTGH
jgi:hypothetical protein